MTDQLKIYAQTALLPEGWVNNICVTVDSSGRISNVEFGVEPQTEQHVSVENQNLQNRILLPAMSNLHSHTFQRAMAGLTEKRIQKQDSFWSWRKLMYRFMEDLIPEQIEAIAAFVFMEMLECGYASVGEFHYLHHQQGGKHYENIAETSLRIIDAAQKTGIGLTHLPVFYGQGGLDGKSLADSQLRFGCNPEQFFRILEQAQDAFRYAPEDYLLGIAPHSLRAVSPADLKEILGSRSENSALNSAPVHIHIAEQVKEVIEIQEKYNLSPVEWLQENVALDDCWCLVHATHMTPDEIHNLAKTGAVAGLCPITEANLGDGIFDGTTWLESCGKYGIGSDSNVRISLTEELRMLEYSQRLSRQERNVMTQSSGSVGRALYENSLSGGVQALGRKSGSIAIGMWADLLALDADAMAFCSCSEDEILDRWIFSADDSIVSEVWSAGRQKVVNGRHILHDQIEKQYRLVIQKLQQ
ncbi:MAG: formimidoylglutamate deiminase [SAR324 cluster bacterium]|nr:formimidoylglutamate deiminase [SAR324 cluster bacterium]